MDIGFFGSVRRWLGSMEDCKFGDCLDRRCKYLSLDQSNKVLSIFSRNRSQSPLLASFLPSEKLCAV